MNRKAFRLGDAKMKTRTDNRKVNLRGITTRTGVTTTNAYKRDLRRKLTFHSMQPSLGLGILASAATEGEDCTKLADLV